jgi:cobalamin synthase
MPLGLKEGALPSLSFPLRSFWLPPPGKAAKNCFLSLSFALASAATIAFPAATIAFAASAAIATAVAVTVGCLFSEEANWKSSDVGGDCGGGCFHLSRGAFTRR